MDSPAVGRHCGNCGGEDNDDGDGDNDGIDDDDDDDDEEEEEEEEAGDDEADAFPSPERTDRRPSDTAAKAAGRVLPRGGAGVARRCGAVPLPHGWIK
ncbi:MAG: hypothetical protein LBQ79_09855 [Deltaproteobacteria bacterium]|jgi:hypothetical protein|nr:hypothetical protein [Deltaproteobacteria bacterium]